MRVSSSTTGCEPVHTAKTVKGRLHLLAISSATGRASRRSTGFATWRAPNEEGSARGSGERERGKPLSPLSPSHLCIHSIQAGQQLARLVRRRAEFLQLLRLQRQPLRRRLAGRRPLLLLGRRRLWPLAALAEQRFHLGVLSRQQA